MDAPPGDREDRSPSLTVVVPATDDAPTLSRCLEAIRSAADPPEQVVVVDDPSIDHAAAARNEGAREAVGDVLVFVDADVVVHEDVFVRIRESFASDPELMALFGSYDEAPGARDLVSVFRNLLHHHVHQTGAGPACTFWAGLGAMRRDAFEDHGGFTEHPIEDIELGMRLSRDGARIVLDPSIQGKHLKRWTVWSMVRTDLLIRGAPWIGLLLEHRDHVSTSALNLGWRHRLSALASVALVAAAPLAVALPLAGLALGLFSLGALVALNRSFYGLLLRREGFARTAGGVALHVVHLLTAVVALPLGIVARPLWRPKPDPSTA